MARGAATAMFGHGLGPLSDREIRQAAGRVLPRLDTFALREGRAGPDLARELGVPDARVVITGDDAIELAHAARPATPGSAIGVNLRVARSAGVDESYIALVGQRVREFAADLGAPLLGIPIGRGRASNDNATIARLLADHAGEVDDGSGLDTTDKVIGQVRRCRIVVTGAYHAAVFALAQGIPTVCLARSAYFSDKMQGLAFQFPVGCTVVDLGAPDLAVRLETALRHAWQSAEGVRAGLLGSAERQIAASRAAYAQFADVVRARAARTGAVPSGDRGGSGLRTSDRRAAAKVTTP